MQFERRPLEDTENTILVHTVRTKGHTLKKGKKITSADIDLLKQEGIESLMIVSLQDGDIGEDQAAGILAEETAGSNIRINKPDTGRCNLYSKCRGLLVISHAGVDQINGVHESLTIATLPPYTGVIEGQLIATVKIIPFAVTKRHLVSCLQAVRKYSPVLTVAPYTIKKAGFIQTCLPGVKKNTLDKTFKTLSVRLQELGCAIDRELRCNHDIGEISTAIENVTSPDTDIIILSSASAIADRRDVVPMAIKNTGGEIIHFGMPVDPGNLLLYARINGIPILGMPGCARSPKLNGFDLILQRIAVNLNVTSRDIMGLGMGGLLKEIASRPRPREDRN